MARKKKQQQPSSAFRLRVYRLGHRWAAQVIPPGRTDWVYGTTAQSRDGATREATAWIQRHGKDCVIIVESDDSTQPFPGG